MACVDHMTIGVIYDSKHEITENDEDVVINKGSPQLSIQNVQDTLTDTMFTEECEQKEQYQDPNLSTSSKSVENQKSDKDSSSDCEEDDNNYLCESDMEISCEKEDETKRDSMGDSSNRCKEQKRKRLIQENLIVNMTSVHPADGIFRGKTFQTKVEESIITDMMSDGILREILTWLERQVMSS